MPPIRVREKEAFEEVKVLSGAVIKAHGGTVLVPNPAPNHRDGGVEGMAIAIGCASQDATKAFCGSEASAETQRVREEISGTGLILVEGPWRRLRGSPAGFELQGGARRTCRIELGTLRGYTVEEAMGHRINLPGQDPAAIVAFVRDCAAQARVPEADIPKRFGGLAYSDAPVAHFCFAPSGAVD